MNKNRYIITISAAFLLSILQLCLYLTPLASKLELFVLDTFFNLRGKIQPPDEIVILSMDESSYRVLDLPMDKAWPRELHAEVLTKLRDYQVRKVVMDILFLDPGQKPEVDRQLADAIALSPTVLAADLGSRLESSSSGTFSIEELLEPAKIFAEKAQSIALAKLPEDQGRVRNFFFSQSEFSQSLPKLFEAAVSDFSLIKDKKPANRDFINYFGPAGSIKSIPIHQLLNPKGAPPVSVLKDKIVFIGLNLRTEIGPAQKDSFVTPFYERGRMFGVEVQATAAANLLKQNWIKRSPALAENLIVFSICLLMTTALLLLKPFLSSLSLITFILLAISASYLSFLSGYFIPLATVNFISLPVIFTISVLVYYFRTHRQQQISERAFEMYLSPEMVRLMKNDENSLKLGGENIYATAMFTDIQDFTSITENMTASEVSLMLNSYFTEVMNVVIENRGTLIKFIGDAVFALWGAPIKEAEHAKLACDTAIKIQNEVKKFNQSGRFPALNTRIGINTGSMLIGNLGSARRFDYTAIGDSVNLASRLEGINKYFGTNILLTYSSIKEAGWKLPVLNMGDVLVSGKQQAVNIYALFAEPVADNIKSEWEDALIKFRNRNWQHAMNLFKSCSEKDNRLSKAAKFYMTKASDFELNSPPENWNGEICFEAK